MPEHVNKLASLVRIKSNILFLPVASVIHVSAVFESAVDFFIIGDYFLSSQAPKILCALWIVKVRQPYIYIQRLYIYLYIYIPHTAMHGDTKFSFHLLFEGSLQTPISNECLELKVNR